MRIFLIKLNMLLCIWIPSYPILSKIQVTVVWFLSFLVNRDIAKPGHSGYAYKILDSMQWEIRELLLTGIQLVLAIIFEIFVISKHMWIPVILGVLSIVCWMICFVGNIKSYNESLKR